MTVNSNFSLAFFFHVDPLTPGPVVLFQSNVSLISFSQCNWGAFSQRRKGGQGTGGWLSLIFNLGSSQDALNLSAAPNPEPADPWGQPDGLRGGRPASVILCKTGCEGQNLGGFLGIWTS